MKIKLLQSGCPRAHYQAISTADAASRSLGWGWARRQDRLPESSGVTGRTSPSYRKGRLVTLQGSYRAVKLAIMQQRVRSLKPMMINWYLRHAIPFHCRVLIQLITNIWQWSGGYVSKHQWFRDEETEAHVAGPKCMKSVENTTCWDFREN